MATAGNGCLGSGRAGWVEFAEDALGNKTRHRTVTEGFLESSSAPADPSLERLAPPTPQHTWVLFDENPWPSAAPPPQVKAARHSVCSTASFWSTAPPSEGSWTGQSEQSFASIEGVSPCDLNSVEVCAEEPARALAHITSCVFADDEGIDMDSISWSSSSRQTNIVPVEQTSRLNSWVTFDDDGKPTQHPVPHNAVHPPHGHQDGNSNHAATLPGSHLRDLAPDGSSNGGFHPSVNGSISYAEKNPFFNEAFDDVKPSAINPFSSFFDGRQKMKQWSQADGRHADLGSDSVYPVCQSQNPQAVFPFGESGGGGEDLFHDSPVTNKLEELERPRSLQISDPDHAGGPDDEDEGVEEGEEALEQLTGDGTPYMPSHMVTQEGWPMLLRIPEKKNIMSSRHWGPIYVRLSDDGFMRLFYERGLDKPFRSLRLQPRHEVSEHRLQSYEDTGRVHTLSVELLQYREKRRMQPKSPVMHQPVREQLVKLATSCYHDYLSFRHALLQLLRRLPPSDGALPGSPALVPTTPALGGASEEEMQVEVRDEFYGRVAEDDGRIVEQLVVTRINVLAFLSGLPRCQLGLNDVEVKGKELVSRHDIIPSSTTRWIRLLHPELHEEHADELEFVSTRAVVFTPPPRCRFELLRFRTSFAERSLPFTLRTVASVKGVEVTVQSWLLMAQGFVPNRDALTIIPCENVMIRYPIPEIWAKNFRREGVIGEKSLKARFNKGASFGTASSSGTEPAMSVTLGAAKYEQAFKAVVWRIPRLPDKNSVLGHPHTFFCRLELGSDQDVPQALERHLEVEFDMPAATASKTTVRSLSVDNRTDVKKWINYKSHFFYQVPIEQKREDVTNPPADEPGECAPQ